MEIINQWLAQMEIAPLVGAVIIAVVTIVAAKMVQMLGHRIALTASRWSGLGTRVKLFKIIHRPLWITVLLLGILVEVKWISPAARIDFLITGAAKTALAVMWGIVMVRILGLTSSTLSSRYPASSETFLLSQNIGIAFIAILGALAIMSVWGINLTPLLASAGIAGIIIGLAAKDTLGNFFGGISLFLDRPFKHGDYIVLGSGERGRVVDIGLRSTRIVTRDDILITIPNSVIVSTKIINESAPSRKMRVRIKVSVSDKSDLEHVTDVLLKLAKANRMVLPEPQPRVRFRSFGDASLECELLCWIADPENKGRLVHQLNSAVFKEFRAAGINFPLPQRDVIVHNVLEKPPESCADSGKMTGQYIQSGHQENLPLM